MAHTNAQRQCQRLYIPVMLRRQDLRGRHETGLVTVLHGHERCDHGNDGLAAADIALHQPVHGPVTGHVLLDLGDHPFLAAVN